MRRASVTQIGDTAEHALRVATPEDIVLQKLRWYRMGDEIPIDNGGTSWAS